MTIEEFEEEFDLKKGNKLYDDIDWVYELAELFKGKYEEKRKLVEKQFGVITIRSEKNI